VITILHVSVATVKRLTEEQVQDTFKLTVNPTRKMSYIRKIDRKLFTM